VLVKKFTCITKGVTCFLFLSLLSSCTIIDYIKYRNYKCEGSLKTAVTDIPLILTVKGDSLTVSLEGGEQTFDVDTRSNTGILIKRIDSKKFSFDWVLSPTNGTINLKTCEITYPIEYDLLRFLLPLFYNSR